MNGKKAKIIRKAALERSKDLPQATRSILKVMKRDYKQLTYTAKKAINRRSRVK